MELDEREEENIQADILNGILHRQRNYSMPGEISEELVVDGFMKTYNSDIVREVLREMSENEDIPIEKSRGMVAITGTDAAEEMISDLRRSAWD